jgi:hypothetical protein
LPVAGIQLLYLGKKLKYNYLSFSCWPEITSNSLHKRECGGEELHDVVDGDACKTKSHSGSRGVRVLV